MIRVWFKFGGMFHSICSSISWQTSILQVSSFEIMHAHTIMSAILCYQRSLQVSIILCKYNICRLYIYLHVKKPLKSFGHRFHSRFSKVVSIYHTSGPGAPVAPPSRPRPSPSPRPPRPVPLAPVPPHPTRERRLTSKRCRSTRERLWYQRDAAVRDRELWTIRILRTWMSAISS